MSSTFFDFFIFFAPFFLQPVEKTVQMVRAAMGGSVCFYAGTSFYRNSLRSRLARKGGIKPERIKNRPMRENALTG